MNSTMRMGLSVTCLVLFAGCGGSSNEPPKQPSDVTTVETTETTETTEMPAPSAKPPQSAPPSGAASQGTGPSSMNMNEGTPGMNTDTGRGMKTPGQEPLSDGQIAAITSAANEGEIELAELAKKNASSARVKSFATMMLTEHGSVQAKTTTIEKSAKITPVESDISRKLKSETDQTKTSLEHRKGKDFDKAYVDAQVKRHREVLTTLDDELIPNATNAQLKQHLEEVRKHVAHHLSEAEELEKKVDAK